MNVKYDITVHISDNQVEIFVFQDDTQIWLECFKDGETGILEHMRMLGAMFISIQRSLEKGVSE